MNPASGNRAEGAKNEAETVDSGFACDRIERQEFARYEAIEVCEVERNSPLLFPLGEGAKNEPSFGPMNNIYRGLQISHAMRRDRQLRSGAKFAAYDS